MKYYKNSFNDNTMEFITNNLQYILKNDHIILLALMFSCNKSFSFIILISSDFRIFITHLLSIFQKLFILIDITGEGLSPIKTFLHPIKIYAKSFKILKQIFYIYHEKCIMQLSWFLFLFLNILESGYSPSNYLILVMLMIIRIFVLYIYIYIY